MCIGNVYEKYEGVFEKNCYVNCSKLYSVNKNRLNTELGTIDKEDLDSIINKLKKHPKIKKGILKKFNIQI